MVNVQTEIIINCPIDQVATYATDPDNAPEWYVNIDSAVWQTPKPLQIGSRIAFKAQFLGRELAYTYEIIEHIPGQKLVMCTQEGPFPMETTYTWEPINENSTRMTLRNSGLPSGFSKIFAPFMAMMMRRANNKDLRMIKEIMEKILMKEKASRSANSKATKFLHVSPVLGSVDVARDVQWYESQLGFKNVYDSSHYQKGPLDYAVVGRQGLLLHLQFQYPKDMISTDVRFEVQYIEGIIKEFMEKGILDPAKVTRKTPWNTCEFRLLDPSGNRIAFFEDV